MEHRIIMAGFGGQGIMVMGRLLSYAALFAGKEVSWIPAYGVEQRGGTANCSVCVSDEIIAVPIVTEPTSAIIMNEPSLDKFEPMFEKGAIVLVNSSIVKRKLTRTDVTAVYLDVNHIAEEIGDVQYANMVMLGAFAKKTGIVDISIIKDALKKVLSARRQNLLEINHKALEKGYSLV